MNVTKLRDARFLPGSRNCEDGTCCARALIDNVEFNSPVPQNAGQAMSINNVVTKITAKVS